MKASILIPAFNAAHHLEATLLSCVDQGADVVEEIIVVDDHSNDDSEAVFSRVSEAHTEFTWRWPPIRKKEHAARGITPFPYPRAIGFNG